MAELLAERLPFCYLSWKSRPAIGIFPRAAVLMGVAEHLREAGEDMTNGRTLLERFYREHWIAPSQGWCAAGEV